MNYNDFLNFCSNRHWRVQENNGSTAAVVFSSGEQGVFYFPAGIPNCQIQIPESWQAELGKLYSYKRLTNNNILWPLEDLGKLLHFIVEVDTKTVSAAAAAQLAARKSRTEEKWKKAKQKLLNLSSTERVAEITGRVGQDILREMLLITYGGCQITGITQPELLVASHIKPWGECDNDPQERLNENNVLLLSVALDKLFDKYFISFDAESGEMLVSDEIDPDTLLKLGVVPEDMKLKIANAEQAEFLKYHNQKLRKTAVAPQ